MSNRTEFRVNLVHLMHTGVARRVKRWRQFRIGRLLLIIGWVGDTK